MYVDTRSILRPLLEGLAIDPDVASGLDLVRTALLSRPQIEQVARETDLDLRAHTPEQKRGADPQPAGAHLDRGRRPPGAHDSGRRAVCHPLPGPETAPRPSRSSRHPAERVRRECPGREARRARRPPSASSTSRSRSTNSACRMAEARLAEFKKTNVGVMPDSRGDYFQRLQQETAEAGAGAHGARGRREPAQRDPTPTLRRGALPVRFRHGCRAGCRRRSGGGRHHLPDPGPGEAAGRAAAALHGQAPGGRRDTHAHIDELRKRQAEELARVRAGGAATGSLTSVAQDQPDLPEPRDRAEAHRGAGGGTAPGTYRSGRARLHSCGDW